MRVRWQVSPSRMGSVTAMTDCAVLRIDKMAMMEVLHREHELSDLFVFVSAEHTLGRRSS